MTLGMPVCFGVAYSVCSKVRYLAAADSAIMWLLPVSRISFGMTPVRGSASLAINLVAGSIVAVWYFGCVCFCRVLPIAADSGLIFGVGAAVVFWINGNTAGCGLDKPGSIAPCELFCCNIVDAFFASGLPKSESKIDIVRIIWQLGRALLLPHLFGQHLLAS